MTRSVSKSHQHSAMDDAGSDNANSNSGNRREMRASTQSKTAAGRAPGVRPPHKRAADDCASQQQANSAKRPAGNSKGKSSTVAADRVSPVQPAAQAASNTDKDCATAKSDANPQRDDRSSSSSSSASRQQFSRSAFVPSSGSGIAAATPQQQYTRQQALGYSSAASSGSSSSRTATGFASPVLPGFSKPPPSAVDLQRQLQTLLQDRAGSRSYYRKLNSEWKADANQTALAQCEIPFLANMCQLHVAYMDTMMADSQVGRVEAALARMAPQAG